VSLTFRTMLVRLWCDITGDDAVYVKRLTTGKIYVRVLRTKHDPFDDEPSRYVRFLRFGHVDCRESGAAYDVNGVRGWTWKYVDCSKNANIKPLAKQGYL
jgi:hypothetical protein